ncbi:SCO family protein [Gramella sp. AN32]|uniref:SCO family protein n=1 Tax=Christiangramia antarctica TaxID=2058158 RepID=A0ABW5XA01_9FLAO|nr:SCO family protein [Gramella sp. AN32]MCM4154430.1 SCO family protein [Gramella sp. AN32]
MKISKLILFAVLVLGFSCKDNPGKPAPEQARLEKIEEEEIPELSVYNLPAVWTTQDNKQIELEDLKGNVLVMVMIYTSCKSACPRLVADMRNIAADVPENKSLKYVFVSIDPETDTPQRLKDFAKENQMDDEKWLFLRGTPEATREFAAVLAVSYKRISPMDFSHSNIISVFDKQGVLVHQKQGLGVDDSETVASIIKELEK